MRILILVMSVILVACNPRNVDINPHVNPTTIIGRYSNKTDVVELSADHVFNMNGRNKIIGTWEIQGSYIVLKPTSNIELKVLEEDGKYELLILDDAHQDPDSWDWSQLMIKEK